MRRYVGLAVALGALLWPCVAAAQVRGGRALPDAQVQLREKLASPFLARADWALDWDRARALAKQQRMLIFGYFTTAGY